MFLGQVRLLDVVIRHCIWGPDLAVFAMGSKELLLLLLIIFVNLLALWQFLQLLIQLLSHTIVCIIYIIIHTVYVSISFSPHCERVGLILSILSLADRE